MKAVELAAISKMLLTNFTNNPAECSLCPSHNGCASKEALAPKINCPEELKFLQITSDWLHGHFPKCVALLGRERGRGGRIRWMNSRSASTPCQSRVPYRRLTPCSVSQPTPDSSSRSPSPCFL